MALNHFTPQPERKCEGERLFEGRVLALERDIVSLPDGSTSLREVIRHKGAVCVIPLDSENNVILVKQFRYAVGQVMTEIPAGKLDSKEEIPQDAAARELAEETGYSAGRLIPMGVYYGSPAILDEKIYMFAALDLTAGNVHLDPDEYVSVCKMPLSEAVDMATAGAFPDGKTQCAILRLAQMQAKGLLSVNGDKA